VSEPRLTGIVLAGGRSTRFAGDKLAVEVDGRPLLHHAMAAVATVVDEVVVVIGPDGASPRLPADLGVPIRVARDAAPGLGPLAGLAAGLAAARAPLALVVGGDQPHLAPALLAELLLRLGPAADGPTLDVVALEVGGRLRPLPSAVRVAVVGPAAAVALAGGTRSLVGLFAQLRAGVLGPEHWRRLDPVGDSLRDVDTPDNLRSSWRRADGEPS
jgi:molybdopterin-guanine dinucleotide biosynthesis protein A